MVRRGEFPVGSKVLYAHLGGGLHSTHTASCFATVEGVGSCPRAGASYAKTSTALRPFFLALYMASSP